MAKKDNEYWQKRFEILQEALLNKGDTYASDLIEQYEKTSRSIQDKILVWYLRLAENNEVSLARAKQLLSDKELKEFKWSIEEYIKHGKENTYTNEWLKELENVSAKVHISWLEAMHVEIQHQVELLTKRQDDATTGLLKDIFSEGYYQTVYELQKGLDAVSNIQKLDEAYIDKVMSKPWTLDKKTFSDRIWSNKNQLVDTLHKELTQSVIRGDAPDKVINSIAKKMGVGKKQAARVVLTESAFMTSESRKEGYKKLDVEKYKIVATLDLKTSELCRSLDGKVFKISEYKAGLTANPFHPNCRTTTAPYYDDEPASKRAARDPVTGKTVYVDNMAYKEWHKKYVEGNPVAELNELKIKNAGDDRKQYDNYIQILGKENLPQTFDAFQSVKYTDGNEYGILKAQIKGMTYYNKAIANEPEITATVKKIAEDGNLNALGLEYRIKGKESYLRKIRINYNPDGNEYEINDILRYTYGADANNLAARTLDSIDKYSSIGYNTVKVKNSWYNEDNPYKGINTIIQAPNGQKFELQYHTPEGFELKNGKQHELYEKQRLITDEESPEYISLRNQMFELSDKLTVPDGIERVK